MLKCKQCGREFPQKIFGCSPDFCSISCRNKSRIIPNKKSTFVCRWCGKEFVEWTYRNPTICSNQCRSEYGAHQPRPNARRPENKVERICIECGKSFEVHKSQIGRNQNGGSYCSVECRGNAISKKMRGENNINWIGGGWDTRGKNWLAQARKARKRDNYTCRVCGKNGKKDKIPIEVHHIKPYRLFNGDFESANRLDNLISLCRQCHVRVEKNPSILPD